MGPSKFEFTNYVKLSIFKTISKAQTLGENLNFIHTLNNYKNKKEKKKI